MEPERGRAMSGITTPKNILEDILRELSFKPFVNRWQRWFFKFAGWTLGLDLAFMFGAVVGFQVWGAKLPVPILLLVTLGLPTISGLSLMLSTLAVVAPQLFRYFRHAERAELEPVLDSFDEELDLINHLANNYERHDLEYAQERVALEAGQSRSWKALCVGALDKVGIFPLAVAAYFSWQKLRADQPLVFSGLPGVEWGVVITLVVIYLLSMSQYSTCLQLDRFCLVLKHAAEKKKLEQSARNADTSLQSIPVSPSPTHDGAPLTT
jgi:hypothetical protein